MLGDHVSAEDGTGAVHTAPGHGQEDFAVGQQYGLIEQLHRRADESGRCARRVPAVDAARRWPDPRRPAHLEGERHDRRRAARQRRAARASRSSSTAIRIAGATRRRWRSAPRRSGSSRWSRPACAAMRCARSARSRWIPEWGEARIYGMIEGRPDWCISRQRTWGVPIALFVDRETGEPHPRSPELMRQVADVVEREGVDAWYALDADDAAGRRRRAATTRSPTSSTSGSIPASPTSACWRSVRRTACASRPTSTWKAPTSTAAGSTARC